MLLSIFQTIEFYVITAFVAAAVIGFAAMPARRGAVRTFLFGSTLIDDAAMSVPGIVVTVEQDGAVLLHRFGLEGVAMDGAYSIAVNIAGLDVTVDERLVAGRGAQMATAAVVRMDCFGAERYHFHFRSEATGRSAAFSLNIRPGNRIERRLS